MIPLTKQFHSKIHEKSVRNYKKRQVDSTFFHKETHKIEKSPTLLEKSPTLLEKSPTPKSLYNQYISKYYLPSNQPPINIENAQGCKNSNHPSQYMDYTSFGNSFTHFHQKNVLSVLNPPKTKLPNLGNIKSCILIVDYPACFGGGTRFFINTIISKYKYYQTFLIVRNHDSVIEFSVNDEYVLDQKYTENSAIQFIEDNIDKIDKIFVNHIIGHSDPFIHKLFDFKKEVTTVTHDYSLLCNKSQPYVFEIASDLREDQLISKFDKVILQDTANLSIYGGYIDTTPNKQSIVVSPLPDFKNKLARILTNNTKIVIGIIGEVSDIKGKFVVEQINRYILLYNLNVEICIFGYLHNNHPERKNSDVDSLKNVAINRYANIDELNDLLMKYRPNLLMESSIWCETYSYTLTLAMITDLPIISLKKPFHCAIENRLKNYNKAFFCDGISDFFSHILYKKQDYFYTISPVLYYNSFWDNYFITKIERKTPAKNHQLSAPKIPKYGIRSYCIYFPQFHEFPENNRSFYPGFTDIQNLDLLRKSDFYCELETPSLTEFRLTKTTEYNYMKRGDILQKQIDILYDYNIAGFAIYYYWFSLNTITKEHAIMNNVVDRFFDGSLQMRGRKCFLIWANEPWSKNAAFGTTHEKIENDYSDETMYDKIADNLMDYFASEHYLKIDNQPVFQLHQPWHLTDRQIDAFYEKICKKAILHGFSGVHFTINNLNKTYEKYINTNHHFDYKNPSKSTYYDEKDGQIYLDYKKYVDQDINTAKKASPEIHTIVFDFDNRTRLFKPRKLGCSTICIKNTEFQKISFIEKIREKYNKKKSSEVENILLINAWNEWGEKMSVEPSNEYGYYYLNLLQEYLC